MDSSSSHSSSDDSDPEVPDEEFREASASSTQDENRMNSTEELGLLLSQSLPSVRLPAVAGRRKEKVPVLPDLPPGYKGKMMAHKSGKVEMKLGDALFNFSPRAVRELPWYVAAWKIDEHTVVTPDLDSLMDDGGNLSALSSKKKERAEPSQNEGIPPDSGDTDEDLSLEDLRKNLPSLSPYPDQNKDSDHDQTKIKPENELDLMDDRAMEATSNRLKRIEDKSSKKSDGNVQEDAGI